MMELDPSDVRSIVQGLGALKKSIDRIREQTRIVEIKQQEVTEAHTRTTEENKELIKKLRLLEERESEHRDKVVEEHRRFKDLDSRHKALKDKIRQCRNNEGTLTIVIQICM